MDELLNGCPCPLPPVPSMLAPQLHRRGLGQCLLLSTAPFVLEWCHSSGVASTLKVILSVYCVGESHNQIPQRVALT